MLPAFPTPLVRIANLFPDRRVYAKCEFPVPSGSFKIRGAKHLLDHLSRELGPRELVVPSMGNTALAAALGAKLYGFRMIGVVPTTITRAKDEKLQALGVELVKVEGGGSDLLRHATELARKRGAYFVHPHLDPLWTDGYQMMMAEILAALPDCRTLVFPVGGGGLLMGLTEYLARPRAALRVVGVEAYNAPKYARFTHARSKTIADGLVLEVPHPQVQERIASTGLAIDMVHDDAIRVAVAALFRMQGLLVEPSSAVPVAWVQAHAAELEEPICVVLTGENVAREDFYRLIEGVG
ncbi:MAG TPA: PLP-dependent lyase/thiolase [Gemmataceae bacterium]|nr:PLP-dependent lyase/thiolase [Gemmataceae bacterium]